MNNNEGSFNDEELRKRAASNEELNIRHLWKVKLKRKKREF